MPVPTISAERLASHNALNVSAAELQGLMRHADQATTQACINMAEQIQGTSQEKLFVPDVLKKEA